jgi:hypothetical protein
MVKALQAFLCCKEHCSAAIASIAAAGPPAPPVLDMRLLSGSAPALLGVACCCCFTGVVSSWAWLLLLDLQQACATVAAAVLNRGVV